MKSHQYTNCKAWMEQPQDAVMTEEKKSGCFCHEACHYGGNNIE
jgi:hypothetical protein